MQELESEDLEHVSGGAYWLIPIFLYAAYKGYEHKSREIRNEKAAEEERLG